MRIDTAKYRISCKEFPERLEFEQGFDFSGEVIKPFTARVTKEVLDFKEEMVHRKLIALGWTPPGEKAITQKLVSALEYALEEADGWFDDSHGGRLDTNEMNAARKILGEGKEALKCTTTKSS
jgi:hypothetical protein